MVSKAPSPMLAKALAERDDALANMNVLAVKLARIKSDYDAATPDSPAHLELRRIGDEVADQLEAAIELLEDRQVTVGFWRAVERGRQSLG